MSSPTAKRHSKLCRMCLVSDEKVTYLSLNYIIAFNSQDSWPIFNFVEKYLNLNTSNGDKLPQYICSECITHLINFHFFYEKCHENDENLREQLNVHLQDARIPNLIIETVDLFGSDHEKEKGDVTHKEIPDLNSLLKRIVPNKATPVKLLEYSKDLVKRPPVDKAPPSSHKNSQSIANSSDEFSPEYLDEPEAPKQVPTKNSSEIAAVDDDEINPEYCKEVERGGITYYVCVICKKGFKHKRILIRHVEFHIGSYPYTCSVCFSTYAKKSQVLLHLSSVHQQPVDALTFPCRYCDSEFCIERDLVEHYITYHPAIKNSTRKQYMCEACGNEIKDYNGHIKFLEAQNLYDCDVCEKRYITGRMFNKQIQRHSEKIQFKCDYCGNNFKTYEILKNHCKIHAAEKTHACHLCNKKFLRLVGFKMHMKNHELPNLPKRPRPSKSMLNYVEELFSSDDDCEMINDGSTTESCFEESEEILLE